MKTLDNAECRSNVQNAALNIFKIIDESEIVDCENLKEFNKNSFEINNNNCNPESTTSSETATCNNRNRNNSISSEINNLNE